MASFSWFTRNFPYLTLHLVSAAKRELKIHLQPIRSTRFIVSVFRGPPVRTDWKTPVPNSKLRQISLVSWRLEDLQHLSIERIALLQIKKTSRSTASAFHLSISLSWGQSLTWSWRGSAGRVFLKRHEILQKGLVCPRLELLKLTKVALNAYTLRIEPFRKSQEVF